MIPEIRKNLLKNILLFYAFPLQAVDPHLHSTVPLNSTLEYLIVSSMLIGTQNYDRATKGAPQYFCLREVLQ